MSYKNDDGMNAVNQTKYRDEQEANMEEMSWYFSLFSLLLTTVLILSKFLHDRPAINSIISEAALVLLIGMAAGFFVFLFYQDVTEDEEDIEDGGDYEENVLAESLLSFSPNIFFMAMLPPIIFNSGYQLRRELFYRHIKPIVSFACIGTTLSSLCTGVTLYGISQVGWIGFEFHPTVVELLAFGSLIAATDTVSVLSVFQAKKVDPHLFYLVFGESALNDAVALVLFNTFSGFLKANFNGSDGFAPRKLLFLVEFAASAIGSPLLGVVLSFGIALIFKHIDFRHQPALELPLYLLLMYTPFVIAECFDMSGIVTIFFSGISARRYIVPNVSTETANSAEVLFKTTAYLAETCIFLELGLSVFGLPANSFNWALIGWTFLASLLGRAVGIYPIAYLFNLSLKEKLVVTQAADVDSIEMVPSGESFVTRVSTGSVSSVTKKVKRKTPKRRKDKKIPPNFAHILWFAGLRGAVAYACARKFPNIYGHQDEFIATTMVIVLISIIIMGGATEHLLRYLEVDMGVDEDEYMEDWHKERRLKGAFHDFEDQYVFRVAVRGSSGSDTGLFDDSKEDRKMTEESGDCAFDYQRSNGADV